MMIILWFYLLLILTVTHLMFYCCQLEVIFVLKHIKPGVLDHSETGVEGAQGVELAQRIYRSSTQIHLTLSQMETIPEYFLPIPKMYSSMEGEIIPN